MKDSKPYRVALRCLHDSAEDGDWEWIAEQYHAAELCDDFAAAVGITREAVAWACEIIGIRQGERPSVDDVAGELFKAFEEAHYARSAPHRVTNHQTGEQIRRATVSEYFQSLEAAREDGGQGVIVVDGVACFVD
jgi:hypothetical protein